MLQKLPVALPAALLGAALLLGGCNALRVYTIDLPQGNPLTREQAAQIRVGMTQAQVRYVLGTPLVTDTLHPERWDYVYRFKPGTYAREAGVKQTINQHLAVYFADGKVSRIDGAETLPEKSQLALPSRDGTLRAEPL